jgi:hypothetical protein
MDCRRREAGKESGAEKRPLCRPPSKQPCNGECKCAHTASCHALWHNRQNLQLLSFAGTKP